MEKNPFIILVCTFLFIRMVVSSGFIVLRCGVMLVGHYFGLVNPYMYRAMFPLVSIRSLKDSQTLFCVNKAIEKWWATAILKK